MIPQDVFAQPKRQADLGRRKDQTTERATRYRPSNISAAKNHPRNAAGDSRSRIICPIHIPIQASPSATIVSLAFETWSPPSMPTLTASASVETVKDSPSA